MTSRVHRAAHLVTCFMLSLMAPVAWTQDKAPDAAAGDPEGIEIRGYCPASYMLNSTATKGKPEFAYTYNDKTYWLSSQEALDAFKTTTIKYLPAYDGLCATALGGRYGNLRFSDPTIFEVYGGKTYLFSSERAKNAFVKDRYRYIERAKIAFEKPEGKTPKEALVRGKDDGRRKAGPTRTSPVMELRGKQVPEVELIMADGTSTSTKDINQPTLMMFYASWCPHCKKALPKLEAMSKDAELSGARIMAVSLDQLKDDGHEGRRAVSRSEVIKQFSDLSLSLPQAFANPGRAAFLLGVKGYPTFMLVGKSGIVESAYVSSVGLNDGTMQTDLKVLLSGRSLTPPNPEGSSSISDAPKHALELAGKPMPKTSFTAAHDNSIVDLSASNKSKATLVMFYTTYCDFSEEALPIVNDWVKSYDGQAVRFFGVTHDIISDSYSEMDDRIKPLGDVKDHWKKLQMKFPMLVDPGRSAKKDLQVKVYPTFLLIDAQNKVEKVYFGLGPVREGTIRADIDRLLGVASSS